MDSKVLYEALLGVKQPWIVERVDMDVAKQEVTVTVAHPPKTRFRCPQCERELVVFDHLAENVFEALAIDVLLAANVKCGAELLRVTWDEAWGVMQRAVARGRAAKPAAVPEHIGVDEKAISKRHRYVTLVCDLERGSVEYVEEDRTQASLGRYFEAITPDQLEGVKAASAWTCGIHTSRP